MRDVIDWEETKKGGMQGEEEAETPAAGTGSPGRTDVRLVGGVGCHLPWSCISDDETAEEEEIT